MITAVTLYFILSLFRTYNITTSISITPSKISPLLIRRHSTVCHFLSSCLHIRQSYKGLIVIEIGNTTRSSKTKKTKPRRTRIP